MNKTPFWIIFQSFNTTNMNILFPLQAITAATISILLNATRNILTVYSKYIRLVIVYDQEDPQVTLILMVGSFRGSAGELPWSILKENLVALRLALDTPIFLIIIPSRPASQI